VFKFTALLWPEPVELEPLKEERRTYSAYVFGLGRNWKWSFSLIMW